MPTLNWIGKEAFEKVRGHVVQVAALAASGDLDGIEAFDHLWDKRQRGYRAMGYRVDSGALAVGSFEW